VELHFVSRCLLLFAAVLVGLPAHSQSGECLSRSIVVTVASPRGRSGESPVISLAPPDLHIKAAGKDVSIESVVSPSNPLRVAIILDVGSSQTKSTWDTTVLAMRTFPRQFPDDTEFSLLTFDDKVHATIPFKQGPHVLDESLTLLSPSKNKESEDALYDALTAATGTFGAPQSGDSEFLITAWEGGAKSKRQATLVQSLSENGVRLFGASFDQSGLPGKLLSGFSVTATSFAAADAAARTSGGLWFRGSGTEAATDLLVRVVGAMIRDFYTIALKLAQPIVKPEKLSIEMAAGSREHLRPKVSPGDVRLSYPPMLYPCH
jgi:hypothetical protein